MKVQSDIETHGQAARRADAVLDGGHDFIAMINEATAPLTGGDYFRTLVARLASSLGVDKALVTECLTYPDNHVRTLAFWEESSYAEDITFDLAGTPCQDVIGNAEFCFIESGMQKLFPEWADEEGGVESFIGIPVFAPSDGRVVGHIAVYDRKAMSDRPIVESMFRIVAARVGAEIERAQAERALRDSEERARQHLSQLAHASRLSTMGELATALAHEVNQPLTAVLTNCRACAKLLDQGNIDREVLVSALHRSIESAEHASQVVKRMREFSKRGEIKPRLVPAGTLLADCRLLLETETRHHQVELNMTIDPELPKVRVDNVLIQQVILNLTRNAIEAINRSENKDRRVRITIQTDASAEQITIHLADTGGGINDELRDSLFEPFATGRKDGLGMGLSLCRSIIENHSGRIWLAETGNQGSTFCFTIPTETSPTSLAQSSQSR